MAHTRLLTSARHRRRRQHPKQPIQRQGPRDLTTRTFLCPALCGCRIRMRGRFVSEEIWDGAEKISYQHPAPWSIVEGSLAIRAVCAAHAPLLHTPPLADPHYGCPGYLLFHNGHVLWPRKGRTTGDLQLAVAEARRLAEEQQRVLPETDIRQLVDAFIVDLVEQRQAAPSLTPAELLYLHLYDYCGQVWHSDICGCAIAEVTQRSDRQAQHQVLQHPHFTRHCWIHRDDPQHVRARAENIRKNTVLGRIKQQFGALTEGPLGSGSVLEWGFDAQRHLIIQTSDPAHLVLQAEITDETCRLVLRLSA